MNLDKQILEELEKFKLMSNYSPKKTLTENLIFEQNSANADILTHLKIGASGPLGIGAGTVISRISQGIDLIKDVNQFREINAEMAKNPVKGYTSIVKLLQGEIDGADVTAIQTIKNSLNKKGINLIYKSKEGSGEVDPASISIQGEGDSGTTATNITPRQQHINNTYCSVKNGIITAGGGWNGKKWADYTVGVNPKVSAEEIKAAKKSCPTAELSKRVAYQWKQDKTFPLTYGMMGDNIKRLQTAIGATPDGKFGKRTQAALDAKVKELGLAYDKKIGLKQEDFNTIVSPALSGNVKTSDITKPIDTNKFKLDANRFNYLNAPNQTPTGGGDVTNVPPTYQ